MKLTKSILAAATLLVAILCSAPVHAAVITQDFQWGMLNEIRLNDYTDNREESMYVSEVFDVGLFDSSLGTLNAVSWSVTGVADYGIRGSFRDDDWASYTAGIVQMNALLFQLNFPFFSELVEGTYQEFAPLSGTCSDSIPFPGTFCSISWINNTEQPISFDGMSTASDFLDPFIGTGEFLMTAHQEGVAWWNETDGDNGYVYTGAASFGTGGDISLTYEYAPFETTVPAPPTVWLFGSGLIGLIGLARRKKSSH